LLQNTCFRNAGKPRGAHAHSGL